MRRRALIPAVCLVAFIWWAACSKPAAVTTNPFLSAIGVVGISSPTAQASGAFASRGGSSIATLSSTKSALQAVLDQTDPDTCLTNAFSFSDPTPVLSTCYGPILSYQNHPDGADGANCAISPYPCFDYGKLGIWSAAETTGEACAAAKANATVQLGADVTNSALRAIAGLLCVSKALNLTAPVAGGAPLDLTSAINRTVSGASFTAATISQLSPRTGTVSTWQTRLVGTINGQTMSLTLLHSPVSAGNNTFAGHFFGLIGTGTTNLAFSLSYRQTASALELESRFGLPIDTTADPFDVDNNLDFSHAKLQGQPVSYTLANLDPNSGLGTANIAWMDSTQDSYARMIQLTTTAGLSSDTGVAYIGFGNPLTDATDIGLLKKMICNWGGPGADDSGLAGKAEGQHLVRNSSGIFTADQSAITFAPTNSCAYAPGTLKLALAPAAPAASAAINPQLVNFNSTTGVGDWGNLTLLTAPTY